MSLVQTELVAVLVVFNGDTPRVLTLEDGRSLPNGPLRTDDRSLQASLRAAVERQTGVAVGHLEQLYTFADHPPADGEPRRVAISYLALTRVGAERPAEHASPFDEAGSPAAWRDWYDYFPWEDQACPRAAPAVGALLQRLDDWITRQSPERWEELRQRRDQVFGLNGESWNDELVLQRYELLYEAGLVPEAQMADIGGDACVTGLAMRHDHRRILATAIARLRAKIRYRPVIYELMPDQFTLFALQQAVERVAGRHVHKQNFRRQVAHQGLIEETGDESREAGGRPARLYRFRRSVVMERVVAGSKLPIVRAR